MGDIIKPVCEKMAQDILPAVRALIAKELTGKYKLTQQESAKKIGVTQAAISQYKRELRGYKVKLLQRDKLAIEEIEKIANKFASGEEVKTSDICNVCRIILQKKELECKI